MNGNEKLVEITEKLVSKDPVAQYSGLEQAYRMHEKGYDLTQVFPDIVNLVVSPSIEVRRLCFALTTQMSSIHPDFCMMATAIFQKYMTDRNELVRAMALRAITSLRVRDLSEAALQCIKIGVSDMSPFVRKVAAFGIAKTAQLEPETRPDLRPMLQQLLSDRVQTVLAAAVSVWRDAFEDDWELLHPHIMDLCQVLTDADEWGQALVVRVLERYTRSHFPTPASTQSLPPHHLTILNTVSPFLRSRNAAVVSATASLLFNCAPRDYPARTAERLGSQLVRLAESGDTQTRQLILRQITVMAAKEPKLFAHYVLVFLPRVSDSLQLAVNKLNALSCLVNQDNVGFVLERLCALVFASPIAVAQSQEAHQQYLIATLRALAYVAIAVPSSRPRIVHFLVELISSGDSLLSGSAAAVLRHLVVSISKPEELHEDLKVCIPRIVNSLTAIHSDDALVAIIDLIGLFGVDSAPSVLPDALRVLLRRWPRLSLSVTQAVLTFAARIYCRRQQVASGFADQVVAARKRAIKLEELGAPVAGVKKPEEIDVPTTVAHVQGIIEQLWARVKAFAASHMVADVRDRALALGELVEGGSYTAPVSPVAALGFDTAAASAQRFDAAAAVLDLLSGTVKPDEPKEEAVAEQVEESKPEPEPIEHLVIHGVEPPVSMDPTPEILFAARPPPDLVSDSSVDRSRFLFSTFSFYVAHPILGYQSLPNWQNEVIAQSDREVPSLLQQRPANNAIVSMPVSKNTATAPVTSVTSNTVQAAPTPSFLSSAPAPQPSVSVHNPHVAGLQQRQPVMPAPQRTTDAFDLDSFWGDSKPAEQPEAQQQPEPEAQVVEQPQQSAEVAPQPVDDVLLSLTTPAPAAPAKSGMADLSDLLGF